MFNYSKLDGRITEIFGTKCAFARAMGMGNTSFSQKINNKSQFDQREINKACELLSIPLSDIPDYFFVVMVQKHEQITT